MYDDGDVNDHSLWIKLVYRVEDGAIFWMINFSVQ
jgi:hypothetical protein